MKRFSGRKFSIKPNNKLLKYLGAFVLFIIGIYIVNYIFTVVMRPNMYESFKEGGPSGAARKNQVATGDPKKAAAPAAAPAAASKSLSDFLAPPPSYGPTKIPTVIR
jgi:hypothetical protein